MAAVAAAEELPAAEAAAARRQGGRTRRRRRVVEACRGVPLHLGHHTVSEGGSRGRERPEVPHPVGIIGRMSAGGHEDLPQGQRGDRAGLWPCRAAVPHWRSGPCRDLGLKPIARRPHPALSKLSNTYWRMGTVRTQTIGSKRPPESATVARAGAQQRTHLG